MTLIQRYRAMPRAARWGLWFVAVLIGYFVVAEPVLNATNRMRVRADRLAAGLAEEARILASGSALDAGVSSFGPVLLPDDPDMSPESAQRAIDSVLKARGVSARTTESRTAFGADDAAKLVGPSVRLERLVLTITFDAPPETVVGVVADLEREPAVMAVSRVEMRKADERAAAGRVVKATVVVESWVRGRAISGPTGSAASAAGSNGGVRP